MQRLLRQRDSEESELESQAESEKSSTASQESQIHDGNLQMLASEIWPAAVALAVSVACATLLFPFFTFVTSSGWLKTLLPQARSRVLPQQGVVMTLVYYKRRWGQHSLAKQ